MEYVSQVLLEVNGQSIEDFKSVTEKEVEVRKVVPLMKKIGVVGTRPQYGIDVEYVVPKDAPEFDFDAVADGTLTIDLENGTRKQYSGVYTLKVGETKYDGENEATRTIELVAMKRSA
jgi:hypothetical protein